MSDTEHWFDLCLVETKGPLVEAQVVDDADELLEGLQTARRQLSDQLINERISWRRVG